MRCLKIFFIIVFVFCLVIRIENADGQYKEYELEENDYKKEPYKYVGLLYSKGGRATATLIGKSHIITAAHVIDGLNGKGPLFFFSFLSRKFFQNLSLLFLL